MMTRLKILTATCGALVALAACGGATAGDKGGWKASSYGYGDNQIIGSGELVTENRSIGSFDRLAIDGPIDVVIRQSASRSLVIIAEDNLIDLVRARSEDGLLSLDTTGSFRTRIGIRAVLTVPTLDAVAINASGDVRFDGWNARAIDLAIAGSGEIVLGGEVGDVRALIGGSGDIDLAPARLSYVDADIEGSGEIRKGFAAQAGCDAQRLGHHRGGRCRETRRGAQRLGRNPLPFGEADPASGTQRLGPHRTAPRRRSVRRSRYAPPRHLRVETAPEQVARARFADEA